MRTIRAKAEFGLWFVALLGLGYSAFAVLVQKRSEAEAAQMRVSVQAMGKQSPGALLRTSGPQTGVGQPTDEPAGQVLGRVEIGALGLDVPIVAGIEIDSLLKGVGHIEGTAYPGGLGTVGLAGHRDTYLRPLERVEVGMDVRVTDRTGAYHYRVDRTEIVLPEQVNVLGIRSQPELVLITCYPFHYIGPAPKRFVVHAHLISVTPERP